MGGDPRTANGQRPENREPWSDGHEPSKARARDGAVCICEMTRGPKGQRKQKTGGNPRTAVMTEVMHVYEKRRVDLGTLRFEHGRKNKAPRAA